MATTVPQFLLPKANSLLRLQHITSYFRRQQRCKACRYAPTTTSSSTKPRVLEKPAKFNPPSHPARRNRFARRYAGPPLSQADLEAQKTKQYPQTMPPEGSFMHWFLTNRSIHLWITLVRSSFRIYQMAQHLHSISYFIASNAKPMPPPTSPPTPKKLPKS